MGRKDNAPEVQKKSKKIVEKKRRKVFGRGQDLRYEDG